MKYLFLFIILAFSKINLSAQNVTPAFVWTKVNECFSVFVPAYKDSTNASKVKEVSLVECHESWVLTEEDFNRGKTIEAEFFSIGEYVPDTIREIVKNAPIFYLKYYCCPKIYTVIDNPQKLIIYFNDDASVQNIETLKSFFKSNVFVDSVQFVSKEAAKAEMIGTDDVIDFDLIDNINPLPNSLIVHYNPYLRPTESELEQMKYRLQIRYKWINSIDIIEPLLLRLNKILHNPIYFRVRK